ncbi:hypothetical protein [Nannocystis radixulma]|uniref:Uncharacterized protein n=1 Tax=Nannocystis radixulma TaxID=2995305 RepID=A0ABT5BE98_9BACT|nr:hypothetical protein [Nannocystis radixulma]MDC0672474.1 hypothetical protein [Nannocystis radixulma]
MLLVVGSAVLGACGDAGGSDTDDGGSTNGTAVTGGETTSGNSTVTEPGGSASTDPTGGVGLVCDPGGWMLTPLADHGIAGRASGLTADAAGALHLAYYNPSAGGLGYARRSTDGSWTTEASGIDPGAWRHLTIAADAVSGIHIALGYEDSKQVYAARDPGGLWQSEEIGDPPGLSGDGTSMIAMDGAGTPHVVYAANGIVHAERALDDSWTLTPIGANAPGDVQPTIAVDGETLRVCHRQQDGGLCWQRPPGGAWMETQPIGGYRPALAIAPGRMFVSYVQPNIPLAVDVKFAELSTADGTPIAQATLDSGPVEGAWAWSRIAVDTAGAVHVVWVVSLDMSTAAALRHARRNPGGDTWVTTTIACDVHELIPFNGLAVTADGPHVVYEDGGQLTYARPGGP